MFIFQVCQSTDQMAFKTRPFTVLRMITGLNLGNPSPMWSRLVKLHMADKNGTHTKQDMSLHKHASATSLKNGIFHDFMT